MGLVAGPDSGVGCLGTLRRGGGRSEAGIRVESGAPTSWTRSSTERRHKFEKNWVVLENCSGSFGLCVCSNPGKGADRTQVAQSREKAKRREERGMVTEGEVEGGMGGDEKD